MSERLPYRTTTPRASPLVSWRPVIALGLALLIVAMCVTLVLALAARLDPLDRGERARQAERQSNLDARLTDYDLVLAAAWRAVPLFLVAGGAAIAAIIAYRRWGSSQAVAEHYRVQALRAEHQHPSVPATLTFSPHYAPHLAFRNDQQGLAALPEVETTAVLPGVTDLASVLSTFRPSPNTILLGLGPGGELITTTTRGLCHVALCGSTGGGKTNLMRLLSAQLEAIGASVVIADPHFTQLDLDDPVAGDWRPIARRLHLQPAVKPAEIAELLNWLLDELDERLDRRARQLPIGKPLFIAFDELPIIVKEVEGATESFSKILREGRKVNILGIGAAQDFLVKTLGGSGAVRDCYRTAFYLGGDQVSASVLLDLPRRDIDDQGLGDGIALLRSAATTPAQRVRVPWATNAGVSALLGTPELGLGEVVPGTTIEGRPEPVGEPAGEPVSGEMVPPRHDALDARTAHVAELLREKRGVNEILKVVWGVKGKGPEWQRANEELRELLAQIATHITSER